MSEYYRLVPWYNRSEWHSVYNALYSENLNKQYALNSLLVWKARMPALPSGIESTLSLLQVHVQDSNREANVANDQILRLAYSSAVMRFVNHMLDSAAAKGASLYQAAQHLGVPDWVIDLRHDTAHNNNLPSLTLLRNACEICLEWLKDNYWDKQFEYVQDYTTGKKVATNNEENRINALMYFCSCLSICKHCKIKRVSQIPDAAMRESILTDAMDLLGNFTNIETESVGSLIRDLDIQAKDLLKGKDTVLYVNNALLGEESLFLSPDLLNFLSLNEFKQNYLSRRYVHCFEVLLTFLYANDLLLEFLLALIEMTQGNEEHNKKLLAALWVSEILASLKKTKQFLKKAPVDFASSPPKKVYLKQQYHHWFPNEKNKGLFLDLFKPLPMKLTDIKFLQPIISTYNPYLSYFVNDLLSLVEPKVPQEVSKNICKLAKLISAPDKFQVPFSPEKIYTIADLKDDNEDSEMVEISEKDEDQELLHINALFGIWKLSLKKNWSTCPVGKVLEDGV